MPQIFHMDIFDAGNSHLLSNVTSMIPFFVVSGLRPGQAVRLLVYAANRKGGSERIIMEAQTIQEAEKRTGKGKLILRITSSWSLSVFSSKNMNPINFKSFVNIL